MKEPIRIVVGTVILAAIVGWSLTIVPKDYRVLLGLVELLVLIGAIYLWVMGRSR